MKIELKTVYGPHPSRCFGLSLGIDPLMPPKRCPYDCIYCPLGRTVIRTTQPSLLVKPESVLNDLKKFIEENGIVFEAITIWGLGDPLLNYNIALLVNSVREVLREYECNVPIIVRTTGFNIGSSWIKPLLPLVDYIVIPVDLPSTLRKIYINPAPNLKFTDIVSSVRSIDKAYRDKFIVEVNLFRFENFTNATAIILNELIADIKSLHIDKVLIKTVNRVPKDRRVKPVRGKLINKVVEGFTEEGFSVDMCKDRNYGKITLVNIELGLINHLARKPLKTSEIHYLYGPRGVALAEDLVRRGLAEKINWEKAVYFRLKNI
ncbi:MAG: radical SAM protein [Thermoprotei archaeon]|nr:MAG: radical SAM protein [Thermoprotei archaeon]